MEAKDLMIGDWVYNTHNQQPEQVCEIREHTVMLSYNDLYDYDEIDSIPVTLEIFEKNGFEIEEEYDEIYDTHNYYATLTCVDSEKRNIEVNYSTFGNEITVFCHDRQNVLLYRSLETQIKHVHELQHIFKILKIYKEIVF